MQNKYSQVKVSNKSPFSVTYDNNSQQLLNCYLKKLINILTINSYLQTLTMAQFLLYFSKNRTTTED